EGISQVNLEVSEVSNDLVEKLVARIREVESYCEAKVHSELASVEIQARAQDHTDTPQKVVQGSSYRVRSKYANIDSTVRFWHQGQPKPFIGKLAQDALQLALT
ncbi:MAG: hypothetical protein AAFU83_02820, partial [Bacteroidota bacterium]